MMLLAALSAGTNTKFLPNSLSLFFIRETELLLPHNSCSEMFFEMTNASVYSFHDGIKERVQRFLVNMFPFNPILTI